MENLLLDGVAVHVKSASDGLEDGETGDISKLGVVLDGETTGDGGKLGERDVGGLLVADNGEGATDVGEVRGLEALEEVAVKTEGAVDGGKRGEADGGGVGNGDTGGPLKVGEDDRDVATVGVDVQLGANVAKLHGDIVKVIVVLDVHGVDHCEVDTVERVQLGVADADAAGLLDHVGEGEALESGESNPLDGVDLVKLGEVEGRQNLAIVQVEGASNLPQAVGGQGSELGDVVGDQVTGDDLDVVKHDVVGGAGGNGDAAGEGGACRDGRGITLVLDGCGCGAAGRLSWGIVSLRLARTACCSRSSLTGDTSSGDGHNGREVLERHLWDYGSWITGWRVSLGTIGKLCSCVVCNRGWLVGAAFDARRRPCLERCHGAGGGSVGGDGGGGGDDCVDRVVGRRIDARLTLVLLKLLRLATFV